MKPRFLLNLITCLTLGCISTAQATVLNAGDSVFVTGTTSAANPELAGAIVNDNILDAPFLRIPDPETPFGVDFNIQNRVVRSDVDGTLIFGPRIRFNANITFGFFLIDRIELYGFGDYELDVAYRTDGLGDRGPTMAQRSADGERLGFDFGFPLTISNLSEGVHEESYFMSLNSNARAFENTGRATIFGRSLLYPGQVFRQDFAGLAVPTSVPAVPLPAPALLLFFGMASLAGLKARRRHG